ncbi:MAG: hypothetical protein IKR63_08705, partial [Alloprevotella sp.]|nr:hypothetical protein [Alloprevotella sp.]
DVPSSLVADVCALLLVHAQRSNAYLSFESFGRMGQMVREAYHTMLNRVPRRAKRGVVRGKIPTMWPVREAYCTSRFSFATQLISNSIFLAITIKVFCKICLLQKVFIIFAAKVQKQLYATYL